MISSLVLIFHMQKLEASWFFSKQRNKGEQSIEWSYVKLDVTLVVGEIQVGAVDVWWWWCCIRRALISFNRSPWVISPSFSSWKRTNRDERKKYIRVERTSLILLLLLSPREYRSGLGLVVSIDEFNPNVEVYRGRSLIRYASPNDQSHACFLEEEKKKRNSPF